MQRRYQIEQQRALQEFRQLAREHNPTIQMFLETAVWREVCDLLTHPERLEHEYQGGGKVGASLESVEALKAQRLKLQHALERLIDSFTEGLIEKDQFTSRMAPPTWGCCPSRPVSELSSVACGHPSQPTSQRSNTNTAQGRSTSKLS